MGAANPGVTYDAELFLRETLPRLGMVKLSEIVETKWLPEGVSIRGPPWEGDAARVDAGLSLRNWPESNGRGRGLWGFPMICPQVCGDLTAAPLRCAHMS